MWFLSFMLIVTTAIAAYKIVQYYRYRTWCQECQQKCIARLQIDWQNTVPYHWVHEDVLQGIPSIHGYGVRIGGDKLFIGLRMDNVPTKVENQIIDRLVETSVGLIPQQVRNMITITPLGRNAPLSQIQS